MMEKMMRGLFKALTVLSSRLEVSTKRDGKPNRTEFYENGVLSRS